MIRSRSTAETAASLDPFATDDRALERRRREIHEFIRTAVDDADATGVLVAMSGGIDSTLTATLAVEALGPSAVRGLVLPWLLSAEADAVDAAALADDLGIESDVIHLQPVASALAASVSDDRPADADALGNAVARLRTTVATFEASRRNLAVVGTANRTERLLGYFTKHGDGDADAFPLGDCYKTEVRALADHVGVPARVVERTPTAGLRAGQTDRDDLGAPYRVIDRILARLVDANLGIDETAAELGADADLVRRLARRHLETGHKRTPPAGMADRADREPPTYFHELELRLR